MGARFGITGMRARLDAKNNPRDHGIAWNFGSGLRDWRTLSGTLRIMFSAFSTFCITSFGDVIWHLSKTPTSYYLLDHTAIIFIVFYRGKATTTTPPNINIILLFARGRTQDSCRLGALLCRRWRTQVSKSRETAQVACWSSNGVSRTSESTQVTTCKSGRGHRWRGREKCSSSEYFQLANPQNALSYQSRFSPSTIITDGELRSVLCVFVFQVSFLVVVIRDLTKLRRRRQGDRQKSHRFNEQNNTFANASRFFVHFFDVPSQLRREMTRFSVYLRTGTARW